MGNKISDQYLRLGQTADADPDGLRRTYDIPYSAGSVREIAISNHNREKRILSRHSQREARSLNDIWRQELSLPVFASAANPPNLGGNSGYLGGGEDGSR